MGRPLNKRYFGASANDLVGDDKAGEGVLTVSVKVGSNSASALGIILSQRSETKFKVNDAADESGNEGICTLVNKATGSLGADEMSLQGFVDGNAVYIRKVQNRTMIDFDDNRYTWEIQDDSTANILALTAI
jgi:archaellum component FlaG (FlaF/FlaG flagellin family)